MNTRPVTFTVHVADWPPGRVPPEHAVGALRDVLKRFYSVEAEVTVDDPNAPPTIAELVKVKATPRVAAEQAQLSLL